MLFPSYATGSRAALGGGAGSSGGTIPLTFDDPIFANVTNFTVTTLTTGQNYTDKSSTTNDSIASLRCNGNNTITRVRIDSQEAVRIDGSGTFLFDSCYLEATGQPGDHADVIQCYSPGDGGLVTVRNTCIVAHTQDATAGFFCADNWIGEFHFENTVFSGGPYGLKIHADVGGDQHVYLKDVYFVGPFGANGWGFVNYGGGVVIVEQWDNVREATIVDGVLVPGDLIPAP